MPLPLLETPSYELMLPSTGKKIKYRVTAVAKEGQVAISSYEDGNDGSDEDNLQFPSIPPAQAKNRLPYLVTDTKFAKLWHLQDRKFKRPKAEFRLSIIHSIMLRPVLEVAGI